MLPLEMNWMFHMPTMVAALTGAPPEAALMAAARVASAALCAKARAPIPAWVKTNAAVRALEGPYAGCGVKRGGRPGRPR